MQSLYFLSILFLVLRFLYRFLTRTNVSRSKRAAVNDRERESENEVKHLKLNKSFSKLIEFFPFISFSFLEDNSTITLTLFQFNWIMITLWYTQSVFNIFCYLRHCSRSWIDLLLNNSWCCHTISQFERCCLSNWKYPISYLIKRHLETGSKYYADLLGTE